MDRPSIDVHGARTHNLRDVDVSLPREAWTVVCGVSGSGKSSLVLDTLGAESRRRFLGTLRHGGGGRDLAPRPDVDRIDGLPPAVSAGFSARAPGLRDTLGTVTETSHALRAIFLRAGLPHCPTCGEAVAAYTREGILTALLAHPPGTRLVLTAPRGAGPEALAAAQREGFVRVRVGLGPVRRVEDVDPATVGEGDGVDVVVDRLVVKPEAAERFAASLDQALALGEGRLGVLPAEGDGAPRTYADRPFCGRCGTAWPPLATALFSFNSAAGACPTCQGRGVVPTLRPQDVLPDDLRLSRLVARLGPSLPRAARRALAERVAALLETLPAGRKATAGALSAAQRAALLEGRGPRTPGLMAVLRDHGRTERIASLAPCHDCEGTRLAAYPRAATVAGRTLPALEAEPVDALAAWLDALELPAPTAALVQHARADALARLAFLREVGLGYLALGRAAGTLSGGELRRAQLASACAARMSGLLFLLDEPTAGLHPADRAPLARRLRALVQEGNTVVCVEHDPRMLRAADHWVELGPGAGRDGGHVVAAGPTAAVLAAGDSPTARAVRAVPPPLTDRPRRAGGWVEVRGARLHNLADLDVRFPVEGLTAVTGVSGAGKSTLALEVIAPLARAAAARATGADAARGRLVGGEAFDRVAVASGRAVRHARATAGSVLGVLPPLRALFAATLEARARGWAPAWFSTNVPGGRCDACRGTGWRAVALRDLPEQRVPCDACRGTCFRPEVERVRVKGLSIADVLALDVARAAETFRDLPRVQRPLRAAADVGLGYVPLGEVTARLSGGEALRLRLAAALGRGGRTRTLYVLDEPCAGLHPLDVTHLVDVLLGLAADGNAVVAVEHHAHLIRRADHVLELGPGPGAAGGRLVYAGPPAGLVACAGSPTGRILREASPRGAP